MKKMREPEAGCVGEKARGAARIAGRAVGFRGVDEKVRLSQKAFNGRARDALLSVMAEDDSVFPVGERDQANGDPVLIRDHGLIFETVRFAPRGQIGDDSFGSGWRKLEIS